MAGVDVKVGSTDPKWQEKVASRIDATLPYQRKVFPDRRKGRYLNDPVHWVWEASTVRSNIKSFHTAQLKGFPGMYNLCSTVATMPYQGVTDRMRSECKLAFLSKVREMTTPWQGMVFLGELGELVSGIKGAAKQIFKGARAYRRQAQRLKRLYWSKPARLQSDLEKLYLSWTYGVAPLFGDVGSYLTGVQQLFDTPNVHPVIVTIPSEPQRSTASYSLFEYGLIGVIGSIIAESKASVRIVGAIEETLFGPSLEKAQQLGGLNLQDVVPAAYELLPYSFLIDYFSTLGDVVNGYFTDTRNLIYSTQIEKSEVFGFGIFVPTIGTDPTASYRRRPLIPSVRKVGKLSLNRSKADLSVNLNDIHLTLPNATQWFNTAVLGLQKMRRQDGSIF